MAAISDRLLAAGSATHIAALHGETVTVLTGRDAGKKFIGVREVETDTVLTTELGEDPRARRLIRFKEGQAPNLDSQNTVQTGDGKKWKAVKRPDGAYLTVDYELVEVVNGKDS